jgi:hypothetical protein
VTMTLSGGDEPATVNLKVSVYVQAESILGEVTLRALKATAISGNPSDDWFLQNVIIPQAGSVAAELLPGVKLPPLEFAGVKLTPPAVLITPKHGIVMAALEGKSVPVPPFPPNWPASPFFALLSEDAKVHVARVATRNIAGRSFGDGESVDIGIGIARYKANAFVSRLDLESGGAGTRDLRFRGVIKGNVAAGVELWWLCLTIGVNYTLYAKPDPVGTISLELNGTELSARTKQLDNFVLLVTPDGSVLEIILSALTTPLVQLVTAAFSPLITNLFRGIHFKVMSLPSVTIDVGGVHLVVRPADLRFTTFSSTMTIEGKASIGS